MRRGHEEGVIQRVQGQLPQMVWGREDRMLEGGQKVS